MNRLGLLLASAIVALAACHASPPISMTETTAARVLTNEAAQEEIGRAICKREFTCAKTGIEPRFSDRQSCMKAHEHFDLRAQPCKAGITAERIEFCTMAISRRPCHKILTRIEVLEECRRKDLCGKE